MAPEGYSGQWGKLICERKKIEAENLQSDFLNLT
jgi:hypothetical protein